MDCLDSIACTDEELISLALDGEALSEEANNHLQQCETCKQRLATYKQDNASLLAHLYRSQCPSGEKLSLYCDDLLPEGERVSIASHVKDCPLCATEVEQTRRFLRTLDIDFPASSFSPLALVRTIFATLLFVRKRNLLCVVMASKQPGRASTRPKPSIFPFIFRSRPAGK